MTTTEYRLEIEGLQAQPVTSPLLERTLLDTRVRIRGLVRDGLAISESVDPLRAEMETRGLSITIIEQPGDLWTEQFAQLPEITTFLQSDIAASGAETLTLLSTSGISALDVLHIGTEALLVQTVVDATDVVVGAVGRGFWGTIPQAHYTEDGFALQRPRVTTGVAPSLERRRAYLYRYDLGAGDDPQGDGTLVFRGICVTDAAVGEGGTSWGITIDPLTTVLDVDLGSDIEDPTFPRGYDFTGSGALRVTMSWGSGDSASTFFSDFYETPQQWADALREWISTTIEATSEASVSVTARPEISQLTISVESIQDVRIWFGEDELARADGATSGFGNAQVFVSLGWGDAYGSIGAAGDRLYVASLPGLVSDDLAILTDVSTDTVVNPDRNRNELVEVNLADGYVVFANQPTTEPFVWRSSDSVEVSFTRRFARNTDVAGFRDAIIANAPTLANKQGFPLLTADDLADWSVVASEAAIDLYQSERNYVATGEVGLLDLLTQEFRLLGVFPCFDSSGAIRVRPLVMPTLTEPTVFNLDASNIFASDELISWERSKFGKVSKITLQRGYDAREDDYRRSPVRLVDARSPSPQEMVIEPKSEDARLILPFEVAAMLQSRVAFYSRPYMVATMQVPEDVVSSVFVGDFVGFSSHRLPDPQVGGRGLDSVVGLVVGRDWDFASGYGTLRVMLTFDSLAGYAPELLVTPTSGAGTAWTFEVSGRDPTDRTDLVPGTSTPTAHFAVADRVEVFDWDTPTPTFALATVSAVDGVAGTVSLDFDASWTDPGTPVLMRPQDYDNASSFHRLYFYAADDTAGLGAANDPARIFG